MRRVVSRNSNIFNLVGLVGLGGFLAYSTGVLKGRINGYLGEHLPVKRLTRCVGIFLVFCLITVLICVPVFVYISFQQTETAIPIAQAAETAETEKAEAGNEIGSKGSMISKEIKKAQRNVKKEKKEPLDDSPLELRDVYAEQGTIVSFKAYHPKAEGYTWEVYDPQKDLWEWVSAENICRREDELFRTISVCNVVADQERKVRCQVSIPQNPPVKYEADMHILKGKIKEIQADDIRTEAKKYIAALDVPVQVIYQDGSRESVIGLNGLCFLDREETKSTSTTASGNLQNTITTVRTAHEYTFADLGTKDRMLCYKSIEDDHISVTVTGMDVQEPVIEELNISNIAVCNEDHPVPITIQIKAKDDLTPQRQLEYAFLPEGKKPGKADWQKESSFQAEVSNGIWKAYCRDQSGNVASKEEKILVVDTEAPAVTLELQHKEEWCQTNRIYVSAEDSLPIEYRYCCNEMNEDSGWIKEAVKDVYENGVWNIQVRDAAGNITSQDITVANIDNQLPVIVNITEKSEGEALNNEE